MPRPLLFAVTLAAMLGGCTPGGAREPAGSASPDAGIAFVGVDVVPMDRPEVLRDRTVVVRRDRIVAMGPRGSVRVPPGALRIDAAGRYLMPGLFDMHVHVPSLTPGDSSRVRPLLGLLVAQGVTSARSMVGHPSHLALRDTLRRGRIAAPTLVFAAPQITGPATRSAYFARFMAATPDAARERVRRHAEAGFDFIKLTAGMTPEVFEAVVQQARGLGIPVSGHLSAAVGLRKALDAGYQVEHLDAYLEAAVADSASGRSSESQLAPGEILAHVDPAKLREAARATAAAGVYNTPTLSFFEVTTIREVPLDSLLALPDAAYFSAAAVEAMSAAHRQYWADPPAAEERRRFGEFRRAATRALTEAGAPIMVGSDTPQRFQHYGYGTLREIEALVAAGLTPFQALEAATRVPAEYLGWGGEAGTVAVGRRADLLLLRGNPLDDVGVLRSPEGVVLRGRWLPEGELEALRRAARAPR
ncbi:MAG TPA: amidohydrolase family protein [Longimicrobiaceae bacterium]|nr:amidohydrolase family protein [Longimicrobiaceae bacterium]